MPTPATVHFGGENVALEARHAVMLTAFAANPNRFAAGKPKRSLLPSEVWINQLSHDETTAA